MTAPGAYYPLRRVCRLWITRLFVSITLASSWSFTWASAHAQSSGPEGEEPRQIVVVGDSLMAGYGLAPGEGFVPQLQAAMTAAGANAVLINAGVSGDTTSGGLARLDWSVPPSADAVILGLGGNDALRGISPQESRTNLDKILSRLNERHLPVLLVGMRAPINLGDAYATAFNGLYKALAKKHDLALYPYFFEGLIGDPRYAQSDGIHPSAAGVRLVVRNMLPFVLTLVERADS